MQIKLCAEGCNYNDIILLKQAKPTIGLSMERCGKDIPCKQLTMNFEPYKLAKFSFQLTEIDRYERSHSNTQKLVYMVTWDTVLSPSTDLFSLYMWRLIHTHLDELSYVTYSHKNKEKSYDFMSFIRR